MSKPAPPCRLYAILARNAPIGVIFRRGPSKRVQIIHWDTATDTFTPGQWFHGRIYERRCDLSPNGELLIYFAQKYNARTLRDKEYTYSWTAISRPPYLTALALWPCGPNGGGGGSFSTDTAVWLNQMGDGDIPHPDHLPQGLTVRTRGGFFCEEPLLFLRLAQEGWQHVQKWLGEYIRSAYEIARQEAMKTGLVTGLEFLQSWTGSYSGSRWVTYVPGIHEKPHPTSGQTLVMTTTLTGFKNHYAYSVRDSAGHINKLAGAEWADWDKNGRLVYAQDGTILALAAEAIGHAPPQELINLNGNTPVPVEAPDWAKHW